MPAKARRTKADWTAAALEALREGGLAAVAIEPLAKRLGATKGSAYWHFANREELLRATLERWELERTEGVIDIVEAEPDPVRRLRKLLGYVLASPDGLAVELALLAAPDDPIVKPVQRRVTDRRIDYVATIFTELGFRRAEARRRAALAYAAYVGYAQLARATPDAWPKTKPAQRAYIESTVALLVGPSASTGLADASRLSG